VPATSPRDLQGAVDCSGTPLRQVARGAMPAGKGPSARTLPETWVRRRGEFSSPVEIDAALRRILFSAMVPESAGLCGQSEEILWRRIEGLGGRPPARFQRPCSLRRESGWGEKKKRLSNQQWPRSQAEPPNAGGQTGAKEKFTAKMDFRVMLTPSNIQEGEGKNIHRKSERFKRGAQRIIGVGRESRFRIAVGLGA